jgi:transposase
MRGKDEQQLDVFSYISPEQRVPQDHPLRSLRAMTDEALQQLQPRFNRLYAKTGRPSIAPEKLLRALLLQALYSVRSERMLMEQLDYNLLFRWFVGLNMDDSIWDVTVFTKNRAPARWKRCRSFPPSRAPRHRAAGQQPFTIS